MDAPFFGYSGLRNERVFDLGSYEREGWVDPLGRIPLTKPIIVLFPTGEFPGYPPGTTLAEVIARQAAATSLPVAWLTTPRPAEPK